MSNLPSTNNPLQQSNYQLITRIWIQLLCTKIDTI